MKTYNVTIKGETFVVNVEEAGGSCCSAPAAAPRAAAPAPAPAAAPRAAAPAPAPAAAPAAAGAGSIVSPLPGTILRINVSVGQAVKAGDVLLVLEAMKMENEIPATTSGTVQKIHVTQGATVQTGDVLISL